MTYLPHARKDAHYSEGLCWSFEYLDRLPNHPASFNLLAINAPEVIHFLERIPFDLHHLANHHEQLDLDHHGRRAPLALFFEHLPI